MTFPILIDYTTSMLVTILLTMVGCIIYDECCRPDQRANGFKAWLAIFFVFSFMAYVGHGVLFTLGNTLGVVKCSNEHPVKINGVKQLSEKQKVKFYLANGLGTHGNTRCEHTE